MNATLVDEVGKTTRYEGWYWREKSFHVEEVQPGGVRQEQSCLLPLQPIGVGQE